MPVFALGRAQELLLILDDYWARHKELHGVPIYYASNLARKCMVVYQTYVSAMNENIKRIFRERMAEAEAAGNGDKAGPWDFRYIRSLKNLERFDDMGGCVVLASPGMLQSGISRELLERWAPSEKNGVVMTGYSVEGTMAKQLMNEPDQIPAIMSRGANKPKLGRRGMQTDEKPMIPRRCSVQEYSFAAHVDGVENQTFIEEVGPSVVVSPFIFLYSDAPLLVTYASWSSHQMQRANQAQILVHGERHNMLRLKSKLLSLNAQKPEKQRTKIYSPANTEELRIPFRLTKTAKVVGRLASNPPPTTPEETRMMNGVLVQNDFKLSLMAPEDLREYAGLTTTTIHCKQRLTLSAAGIDLIKWALEGTFGSIEEISAKSKPETNGIINGSSKKHDEDVDGMIEREQDATAFLIMGSVIVRYASGGEVTVEWEGNMLNDGIADAVLAVLFSVESSPAAAKQSAVNGHHSHKHPVEGGSNIHANVTPEQRLERLCMFLEAQFGDQVSPTETPRLLQPVKKGEVETNDIKVEDDVELTEEEQKELEAEELERLHALGIPVPGVEVKVDKNVATVWLETLEVECKNAVLRDRVKAVAERAVETVAPLWGAR